MSHRPRNDVASLVLNHHHHHQHNHHFRLFAASLRRKLISTIICGGGFSPKPDPKPAGNTPIRPEKLADLLNLSDSSSSLRGDKDEDEDDEETEEAVKRKEERLAELTAAVRKLQSDDEDERENGAKIIRKIAKEDVDARSTIAMLGAIPPLIAMVRVHDGVEALYALLNLGIGNDL